jgi:hypothetical protein
MDEWNDTLLLLLTFLCTHTRPGLEDRSLGSGEGIVSVR